MAIICCDVDNLIIDQLDAKSIIHLANTKKYWMRRLGWFIEDCKKMDKKLPNYQGACEIGSVRMLNWLWNKGYDMETITHFIISGLDYGIDKWSFYVCCKRGHLDAAKWIWNKGIQITVTDPDLVRKIFGNPAIQDPTMVAKMIIHDIFIRVANCMCRKKMSVSKKKIMDWLWDKLIEVNYPIDYNTIRIPLYLACYWGNFDTVQWIWNKKIEIGKPINFSDFNLYERDNPFYACYIHENYDIMGWLCDKFKEMGDPIYFAFTDYNFVYACQNAERTKDIGGIKWMSSYHSIYWYKLNAEGELIDYYGKDNSKFD